MSIKKLNLILDAGQSVPYEIAQEIKSLAENGYEYKGQPLPPFNFSIDLNWFYDNLFDRDHEKWENFGFRIYPALVEDHLCIIICRSTNHDPRYEGFYYLIDPQNGVSNYIKLDNVDEVKTHILNFLNNVSIRNDVTNSIGYFRKFSRLYDWYLIRAYAAANGFEEDVEKTNSFTLNIAYGLINMNCADLLYKIYYKQIAEKPEHLLGFTTVIELMYKNSGVGRQSQQGNSQLVNGIIEIGNPCPPRCLGSGLSF